MSGEYTVGIIGAGTILDHHLEALRSRPPFRIVGVAESNPERRDTRAAALGCRGFADWRALIAEAPDIVLILLPHDLHYPVAMEALASSCHVIVEKPMALSGTECGLMIAAARLRKRALLVADTASWTPGAVATGRSYAAGSLGRFLTGSVINVRHYFDPSRPSWFLDPERSGGGMFANLGVHRLAMIRACIPGLTPRAASATQAWIAPHRIEACTSAFIRYDAGASFQLQELGYFQRPGWLAAGIHLVFELGIVSWDEAVWRIQGERETHEQPLSPHTVPYGPLYDELLHDLTAGPLPCSEGNAWDVAVSQAAYRSAREGTEIGVANPCPAEL